MKLPFSLFSKKRESEYFLALLLKEEKATAVIFEELAGKIHIVGEHEEYFSDSIDNLSIDELLEVLDKVISISENSLPPNIETQKTIFGLKENWVQDSQIKKGYLAKLKKISDTLGLVPIGFLIVHEAVAHLLQQKEGVPVSAILVEVGKKNLAVSLVRAGRIMETKRTKIEDSVSKTTDRILHHFTAYEILPSRIILFDNENNEKLNQELISHSWSKSLPFLHVPQITTLQKGLDANAMVAGAATQMGFEILNQSISDNIQQTPKNKSREEKPETEKEIQETDTSKNLTNSAGLNDSVITKEEEIAEEKMISEDFGFQRDKDIAETEKKVKAKKISEKEKIFPSEILKNNEVFFEKEIVSEEESAEIETKRSFLSEFKTIIRSLIRQTKIISIKTREFLFGFKNLSFLSGISLKKGGKIIFVPALIAIFLIFVLFLYIFFLKASVVLNIKPKIIEQKQDVIFSLGLKTDLSENTIQAETIDVSEEGSLSTTATGKKEVGEKAKGTITIYNKTLESKTFPSGTIITGPNKFQFTLDNSVTVASASGDIFSPTTPGTAKALVTAEQIGKESNFPSGTIFTIDSFINVAAKNDTAFSGGSKKEITVVSKNDFDKLLKELQKNLESKAKEDLMKKITAEKSLLPILMNTTTEKKSFDKEIGEETKTVTLTGNFNYQSATYKNSSLEKLANSFLESGQFKDLKLSKNNVKNQIENIKEKNEKEIIATLSIKASLIPKLDIQGLTSTLAGQTFDESKKTLSKLPQVEGVEIKLQPNLSFLPKLLPRLSKNIIVSLETND